MDCSRIQMMAQTSQGKTHKLEFKIPEQEILLSERTLVKQLRVLFSSVLEHGSFVAQKRNINPRIS